ncbi:glucose dehydrogenase [FAD, quinone]-like [Folsomia candida]|uniref:Glucose dehydrogenase [FAD, quinone] n=1 Tax=Folsomia candida TaxID=158441 RepID=A0A226DC73_FOLCA|nr:glucose dehydrogenase [FAD, quinone]-like [Folsomia candida]OXA42327.1 Glucose dehydrogenase [FAD, quinone] [Folsomia candida]
MDQYLLGLHYVKNLAIFLAAIVGPLTSFQSLTNISYDKSVRPDPANYSAYDFIIVGAGTAGGIAAARLSESGKYSVLLIEAGGDPLELNDIPYFHGFNRDRPETDWLYRTVPQKHAAFGYSNNSTPYPRGKSLGGSSNINGMVFLRGNPNDFNEWATITGDSGWSFENVLPYFKKLEHYLTTEGIVVKSMFQIKISIHFKMNGSKQEDNSGFHSKIQTAKDKSLIDINPFTLEVEGITYRRHGKFVKLQAKKEVILSAGAVGSPHLLMLSGVGPRQHLREMNVGS